MYVYPVAYKIRPDNYLVRVKDVGLNFGTNLSPMLFDSYFQNFSSANAFKLQFENKIIYALRNATFSMFFVFDKEGKLHLFNSRSEVKRFLKEVDM